MDSCKKRTVNFSTKEVGILMSLVLKYKGAIECRKTDKMNNTLKQKAWERLSNEFNSICGEPFRDAKVLRGKYENQKKRSKQKFADEKTYLQGTGGGPVKPKIINDIDKQVKEIIGTQMTGFDSEFGGDSTRQNDNKWLGTLRETHNNISDSELPTPAEVVIELMEEDVKDSDEEDSSLSLITALPSDWTKITPEKLRTPKSKPLKTILKKASSNKENTNVLSNKIISWATNKAELASKQNEYLEKEHLLRVEMTKERHKHQMALDTKESDERILIQAKKAELELEILQLKKEKLLVNDICL